MKQKTLLPTAPISAGSMEEDTNPSEELRPLIPAVPVLAFGMCFLFFLIYTFVFG